MKMKKRIFACILIFLLVVPAFPVHGETYGLNASGVFNLPLSVDPTEKSEGFAATVYTNQNGLPTSEANAITETSEGFI